MIINSIEGIISSFVEYLDVPAIYSESSGFPPPLTVPDIKRMTPQKETSKVIKSIRERLTLNSILEKRAINKGEMF